MLFDIAWPELLLIGMIALVVIGPKDLPRALKVAGFWVRKARSLSREFQASVDQMIREAELDEIRQDLKKAAEFDLETEVKSAVDPTGELERSIKPPDLPDYFDETPPLATPAAEAEAPLLAPPNETALPATEQGIAAPEPAAHPDLSEPAADASAPEHEPAKSKPV